MEEPKKEQVREQAVQQISLDIKIRLSPHPDSDKRFIVGKNLKDFLPKFGFDKARNLHPEKASRSLTGDLESFMNGTTDFIGENQDWAFYREVFLLTRPKVI